VADDDDSAHGPRELTVILPPAQRLLSTIEIVDALSAENSAQRLAWNVRITSAIKAGHLPVRYADGFAVAPGTIGAAYGMGTHVRSADVGEWLRAGGWVVTFADPSESASPHATSSAATSHKVTHKSGQPRSYPLDAEINEARRRAPEPDNPQSVWGELSKMAESKFGVLIGFSSDGVQYRSKEYQAAAAPDVFTLKNLRERMRRRVKARQDSPRRG